MAERNLRLPRSHGPRGNLGDSAHVCGRKINDPLVGRIVNGSHVPLVLPYRGAHYPEHRHMPDWLLRHVDLDCRYVGSPRIFRRRHDLYLDLQQIQSNWRSWVRPHRATTAHRSADAALSPGLHQRGRRHQRECGVHAFGDRQPCDRHDVPLRYGTDETIWLRDVSALIWINCDASSAPKALSNGQSNVPHQQATAPP